MSRLYEAPSVSDYGGLVELTSAVHLLLGHSAGADLTFSSPGVAGGGSSPFEAGRLGAGATEPTAFAGTGHHLAAPGGAESGVSGGAAGGSAGSAGAGGQLPFTGFAAAAAAAVGTGMAAAGSALRRRLRRSG